MQKEFQKHTGNKFSKLIPDGISYSIAKVYDGVYSNYPLTEMNFTTIKETIDSVKSEVEKKYGKLSSLPGLDNNIKRIDYILQKVENWILKKELFGNKDAEVFLDSLSNKIDELKEMLKEFD